MAYRMLDSAFPPSAASVAAARADGVALWAGYLGESPRAGVYHVWTRDDFARVEAGGIPTVDIWFPPQGFSAEDPNAGVEAVAAAQTDGVRPGHIIAVDDEAGTSGPNAVDGVRRFSAVVRAAGYRSCAYGLNSFVVQVASLVDLTWRAVYGARPASVADRDGVQWWNSHTAYGAGVDESLVGAAWLNAALSPSVPTSGGTFTVADLDQHLVNRGTLAFVLELLYGRAVTGADLDWFEAHAADVGAGQMEWAIEGLLAGTDKADPAVASAAFKRLQQLGAGGAPPELVAAIKAQLPPTGGTVVPHSHSVSLTGTTSSA